MIGHCGEARHLFRSRGCRKEGKTDLLRSAKLRHGTVEHVEMVEEIDGWDDGDPIGGEKLGHD